MNITFQARRKGYDIQRLSAEDINANFDRIVGDLLARKLAIEAYLIDLDADVDPATSLALVRLADIDPSDVVSFLRRDGTWAVPVVGGIGTLIEAWDADLDALAALASTGFAVRTALNTWAQRSINAGANISITNGNGVAGSPSIAVSGIGSSIQGWDADLDALAALVSTGLPVRTALNTWLLRSIVAGANIAVTNGDGVAGNPSIALTGIGSTIQGWDADLDALAALASTGIAARTGAGTWAQRTVTAGAGISVTNGDGVAGNPTIAVDASVMVWSVLTNGDADAPELVFSDLGDVVEDYMSAALLAAA